MTTANNVKSPEEVVEMVSVRLREIVHDINNALFVTKGFLEEISEDIRDKKYLTPNYDHENFGDMLATVTRNADKIDQNLNILRKFAKEEIFDKSGVPKPPAQEK
jgi:hypothetical protein